MRIDRLDLLRYGRFTDISLGFPRSTADVHIVFGPNEAGKSTSLAAIEDLLFGIRHNSPYNFVHDYGRMRVGGVLHHGESMLELRRRKGNKDTLLGPDEMPLAAGEGVLLPFMGGADQTFFTRMFSLNHERLASGGREILEAKDEVGQMLFSAGAGLSGLRDRIAALDNEADGLWAPRKAGRRKYYQELEALEAAENALREHTITANKWQDLKRAYDAAEEAFGQLETEIESRSGEQRRLSRIRRVYREVLELAELEEAIAKLGETRPFPDDAGDQLEAAVQEEANSRSRIDELRARLNQARAERAGLDCDEDLLRHAEDLQQLHRRRIEVQKEKLDLPNRRAELATAAARLERLAETLGWRGLSVDELMGRIPDRSKVTTVRTLLTQRGKHMSATESARDVLDEAGAEVRDLRGELEMAESAVDVSGLAAVISAARKVGDMDGRIEASEAEVVETGNAIQQALKVLRPQVPEEGLVEAVVPPKSAVQGHRDALRDLEQRRQSCRESIRTTEREIARHRKAYERLARDEAAVSPAQLARARSRRDEGWSLIRRRYVERQSLLEEEVSAFIAETADLPSAYEDSVEAADRLADRRFDNAAAAAQIALTSRQISECQELLESLREEERALLEEGRGLEETWKEMWSEAAFQPLAPDSMLAWLDTRDDILKSTEHGRSARARVEALRKEESEARAAILGELAALGEEGGAVEQQPFRVVLETASAVQQRHERNSEVKAELEGRLRKARSQEAGKRKRLQKAEAAVSDWRQRWASGLDQLGFGQESLPEAVADHLDTIEEMRELVAEIHQLRHERIDKIELDIQTFAGAVAELVGAVASDLARCQPEEAVIELEGRLEEARRLRDQQEEKDRAIASLKKRIGECDSGRRDAEAAIARFQELAGVDGIAELRLAIQNAQRRQELGEKRASLVEALSREGDGLSVTALREECEAADIDQVAAREETLGREIEELRRESVEAGGRRTEARRALDAIGGDDRAARAAAEKQAALAGMRDVAAQYVRVRSAAIVLQWAIDRYRREKQAPLLKRAGRMFATLTLGSFTGLRVEFDDQDRAHLAGIRPDETTVGVSGMSEGTADQLYLALRLASVGEYLDRAHALPFVADDLFINFDDCRAAAGFQVLAELGQKTQVLFFTHHQHLVEIAKATLGESINVISLDEEGALAGVSAGGSRLYEAS